MTDIPALVARLRDRSWPDDPIERNAAADALEAQQREIERLKAKDAADTKHSIDRNSAYESDIKQLEADVKRLMRERDEVRAALRRHGRHDADCAYNIPFSPPRCFHRRPCGCGLDAALGAKEQT
jgi:broad-specificity NMP kinase